MHDARGLRDGVVGLDLVGPPVGEGAGTDPGLGQLVRDLVALEHVLERLDGDAEGLARPHEHQDLIGAVAVAVDVHVAADDAREDLEAQIPARRDRILSAALGLLVGGPSRGVPLGLPEGPVVDGLDAHPRGREAAPVPPVGALGVLAEGELDALAGALEQQLVRAVGVPAQLDDGVPAPDRVGRAV